MLKKSRAGQSILHFKAVRQTIHKHTHTKNLSKGRDKIQSRIRKRFELKIISINYFKINSWNKQSREKIIKIPVSKTQKVLKKIQPKYTDKMKIK